jgi:hypothetical protein
MTGVLPLLLAYVFMAWIKNFTLYHGKAEGN